MIAPAARTKDRSASSAAIARVHTASVGVGDSGVSPISEHEFDDVVELVLQFGIPARHSRLALELNLFAAGEPHAFEKHHTG